MFVSVCDRPSVAEPTETQDRAVMESRSATIHRKMPIPARQLPITESAHKAGIVGDALVRAILAALEVAAERGGAAGLDRRHHFQLGEADVTGVGPAPRRAMARKTSATPGLVLDKPGHDAAEDIVSSSNTGMIGSGMDDCAQGMSTTIGSALHARASASG